MELADLVSSEETSTVLSFTVRASCTEWQAPYPLISPVGWGDALLKVTEQLLEFFDTVLGSISSIESQAKTESYIILVTQLNVGDVCVRYAIEAAPSIITFTTITCWNLF